MSIRIELVFETIEEAAAGLAQLATKFLSATSANTLDNARHARHSDGASPMDAADTTASSLPSGRRGRGRPPKVKAEEVSAPPDLEADTGDDADDTVGEAPVVETAAHTEQDVEPVIAALTEKFKTGSADERAAIRAWRDSVGLGKMVDLDVEHVPAAQELLASMKG